MSLACASVPVPVSPLYPKIRFAFTDHPITVGAGGILLRLYFELIGLRASLAPLLVPFTKTSKFRPRTCCWPGGMGSSWALNVLRTGPAIGATVATAAEPAAVSLARYAWESGFPK